LYLTGTSKPKRCDNNSQRISLDEFQGRNSFIDELVVDYENSSDGCDDTTTPLCVVAQTCERLRSRTPSPVKCPGDAEEGELNSPDYVASIQHKTVITNSSDLDEALRWRVTQRSGCEIVCTSTVQTILNRGNEDIPLSITFCNTTNTCGLKPQVKSLKSPSDESLGSDSICDDTSQITVVPSDRWSRSLEEYREGNIDIPLSGL